MRNKAGYSAPQFADGWGGRVMQSFAIQRHYRQTNGATDIDTRQHLKNSGLKTEHEPGFSSWTPLLFMQKRRRNQAIFGRLYAVLEHFSFDGKFLGPDLRAPPSSVR